MCSGDPLYAPPVNRELFWITCMEARSSPIHNGCNTEAGQIGPTRCSSIEHESLRRRSLHCRLQPCTETCQNRPPSAETSASPGSRWSSSGLSESDGAQYLAKISTLRYC